jgi:hypothetical protein
MFTIDLLKGTGKPPQSHPLWVAGATLAFMALLIVTALDGVRYYRDEGVLATDKRALTHYEGQIREMRDVAEQLSAAAKRRVAVNAFLEEVNKALANHTTWSPTIEVAARNTPPDLLITDIMAKREEQGVGDNVKFGYTLILSVVSPSSASVIEQYVRTLRQVLPLQPGPDSIRIGSQRQQTVDGRTLQSYTLECRLKR